MKEGFVQAYVCAYIKLLYKSKAIIKLITCNLSQVN